MLKSRARPSTKGHLLSSSVMQKVGAQEHIAFYVLKTRSVCMSRDMHWTGKLFFERDNELTRNDLEEESFNDNEEEKVDCFIPNELPSPVLPIPQQRVIDNNKNKPPIPLSTIITRANKNNRTVFHQLSNLALMSTSLKNVEPVTFEDAWHHKDQEERNKWRKAIEDELLMFNTQKVWKLMDVDRNINLIGMKWVFKIKEDGRHKARLVALGYSQQYGFNYDDTYSPIINDLTIRLIITKSKTNDWVLVTIDVKSAFLNTPLDEEMYVKLPVGVEEVKVIVGELKTAKLLKAVYGLKQASRKFYESMVKWLTCYEDLHQ